MAFKIAKENQTKPSPQAETEYAFTIKDASDGISDGKYGPEGQANCFFRFILDDGEHSPFEWGKGLDYPVPPQYTEGPNKGKVRKDDKGALMAAPDTFALKPTKKAGKLTWKALYEACGVEIPFDKDGSAELDGPSLKGHSGKFRTTELKTWEDTEENRGKPSYLHFEFLPKSDAAPARKAAAGGGRRARG